MVNGDNPPPGNKNSASQAPTGPGSGEEETTICPECGGVLTERHEAGTTLWQCRVGHRYSPESLLDAQGLDVEAAMWAAVRALEDRARLLERMADQFEPRGHARGARSFRDKARATNDQARTVREALVRAVPLSLTKDDSGHAGSEETEVRQAWGGGGS
jgi:two-component system, chemotaxis family, protein-glutamate methylesterase/glutaminase